MRKKELEITKAQFKAIIGDEWNEIADILQTNCFCSHCEKGSVGIVDYSVFLNDLNDIIVRGKCSECESDVARYLETGGL